METLRPFGDSMPLALHAPEAAHPHRIFSARMGSSPGPKVNSNAVTFSPSRRNRMRVTVGTLRKKSPLHQIHFDQD